MRSQQDCWTDEAAERDTALVAVAVVTAMTFPAWAPALLWWLVLELT